MGGGSYGFGTLGVLGMILNLVITVGVIVGIVLLIVWLVRRVGGDAGEGAFRAGSSAAPKAAKDILQARYAREEIDREQYQQVLADLG